MARLAESVIKRIKRIKREFSLVRLVESQGHRLKKRGKDYALNCPFHEDRTASLLITLYFSIGKCSSV